MGHRPVSRRCGGRRRTRRPGRPPRRSSPARNVPLTSGRHCTAAPGRARRRRGGLEGAPPAERAGAAVRVVDRAVERRGPQPGDRATAAVGRSGRSRPGGRGPDRPPVVPGLQARGAHSANASNAAAGSSRSSSSPSAAVQVLAGQRQPQVAGEPAGAVAERRRRGLASSRSSSRTAQLSSESWVHDRRLTLSEPTEAHTSSTTHTLAWTYTGVPGVVLDAVHRDPVAAGGPEQRPAPAAGRPGSAACDERPSWSGIVRHHGDQAQARAWRAAPRRSSVTTSADHRYWSSR